MRKDTNAIIKMELESERPLTSGFLAKRAGISRQAAHRHLSSLVKQHELLKVGATKRSYYIKYDSRTAASQKRTIRPVKANYRNKGLQEDKVYDRLEMTSAIMKVPAKNSRDIFRYAFTEMFNNAIEHSKTKRIEAAVYLEGPFICFDVVDRGIGIYNNLMKKFHLMDQLEAVQELLKGKRTTDPKKHSGEGIFFTSKIADKYEIESSKIKLSIDNIRKDEYVKKANKRIGTRVTFKINKNTKKDLSKLFNEYTNEEYKFSKTKATVKLYEQDVDYVSRSQARRLLYGLDQFSEIILDFKGIKGIGQGFADEIFRVYKGEHPEAKLIIRNANNIVLFMIKRAGGPQ